MHILQEWRSFINVEHTDRLHSLLQSCVFFGFTFRTDLPSPAIFYCNFFSKMKHAFLFLCLSVWFLTAVCHFPVPTESLFCCLKNPQVLITLRSSYSCVVPIGIATFLQSLLPSGNVLCGSQTHSVLLLFLNSVRTNFNLCSIPLIKTCSPFLFIALTSGNISLNWHSTFQCGSWRVSQPGNAHLFIYLFVFIFCFRLFPFLIMTSHWVSGCIVVFLSKPIWVDFGE